MEKISIIIPVFNVEPYLEKCLNSVLNQTYSNIEILIINDGSTDRSPQICEEYTLLDSRIKMFHQENKGLSSALNIGLTHFTGDYLGFVDSDDWIEPDMFEVLYKAVKYENVPVSIASYYININNASTLVENKTPIPSGVISTRNMLIYPLDRDNYMGYCGYVWNKLFRADIIKASNLKFDENIKYGMDSLFYFSLILSQNCKGVYTNKPLYHYLQRNSAISKSRSYEIKYDILKIYKQTEDLFNNYGYPDLCFRARGFYCYHAGVIAQIARDNNDIETFKKMQIEIKKHIDDYIKTNTEFPKKCERMRKLLEK